MVWATFAGLVVLSAVHLAQQFWEMLCKCKGAFSLLEEVSQCPGGVLARKEV